MCLNPDIKNLTTFPLFLCMRVYKEERLIFVPFQSKWKLDGCAKVAHIMADRKQRKEGLVASYLPSKSHP